MATAGGKGGKPRHKVTAKPEAAKKKAAPGGQHSLGAHRAQGTGTAPPAATPMSLKVQAPQQGTAAVSAVAAAVAAATRTRGTKLPRPTPATPEDGGECSESPGGSHARCFFY